MRSDSGEMVAIGLVKEIKSCHQMAISKVREGFEFAIKCGELLTEAKAKLEHGNFGGFVEQYFEFSHKTACSYMKLHKDLDALPKLTRASILKSADSISGIQKLLPAPEKKTKPGKGGSGAGSAPGKGGKAAPKPDTPDTETPTGVDEPPAPGMDSPDGPEKCPNCGGANYDRDEDGSYCQDCKEPLADAGDEKVKTQRQKTVKTCEALGRAFDDMDTMLPKPTKHAESEVGVKALLKLAKGWK